MNQSLNLLAEAQDALREDTDNLAADVTAALAPFEGVPALVERHATYITDLTNRLGLVETAQATLVGDMTNAKQAIQTLQNDVNAIRLSRKISPRILTPEDIASPALAMLTVSAKRKVKIVLVGENRQAETTTKGNVFVLTNSAGIHRSISSTATLAPYATVESAKATANTVVNDADVTVNGFTYTPGKVTGVETAQVTDRTLANGRSPDPVNDEYGDTLTKLSDFKINNSTYPISADVVYNEATLKGVPSTGIGEFVYDNTNDFEVRLFFKGAFSVIAIEDVTEAGTSPFTFVYPT